MALTKEELEARLSGITNGPWAKRLVEARLELGPVDNLGVSLGGTRIIALDRLDLSPSNLTRSGRLARVLKPHFIEGVTIRNQKHLATRDAFDQALTIPQLYELAVQTGYLPMECVRKPARSILSDLLWSEPARRFVVDYDYVSVPMLAARVGVSGIQLTKPPDPNPSAALHFAGFLAHLRAFQSDEYIRTWARFLDDYLVEEDEQDRLWKYLHGQRQTGPRRTPHLLLGAQRFVSSLASAFHVLADEEHGMFGLIHAYWLQKFFGYTRNRDGVFVKDADTWGRTDSWAQTLASSERLVPADTDADIASVVRQQFTNRVALLERVFSAVRALAVSTRLEQATEGAEAFMGKTGQIRIYDTPLQVAPSRGGKSDRPTAKT